MEIDFISMYPSIMYSCGISPESIDYIDLVNILHQRFIVSDTWQYIPYVPVCVRYPCVYKVQINVLARWIEHHLFILYYQNGSIRCLSMYLEVNQTIRLWLSFIAWVITYVMNFLPLYTLHSLQEMFSIVHIKNFLNYN